SLSPLSISAPAPTQVPHSFPTRRSSDLTMFLTTCGIDPRTGIAEQTVGEISIHKKMAARSRQLIVLADSSKFSMQASFHAYDFRDRKSTRLNSSHVSISYAVFCLKKKNR